MKAVRIHHIVADEIGKLNLGLRLRLAELLDLLSAGENLGMPVSRPMSGVASGVHELRLKDISGQYRVFYYTRLADAVLVFHFFKKKTQATPKKELSTAQKRLRSMV